MNQQQLPETQTLTTVDGRSVEVPGKFICPITLNIMVSPLCNRAGFNYERSAILSWLERTGTCPLTRKPLRPSELIPNRLLEIKIRQFLADHELQESDFDDESTSHEEMEDDLGTRKFVGFLPVSETEHEEILQRHRLEQSSLLAMVSAQQQRENRRRRRNFFRRRNSSSGDNRSRNSDAQAAPTPLSAESLRDILLAASNIWVFRNCIHTYNL